MPPLLSLSAKELSYECEGHKLFSGVSFALTSSQALIITGDNGVGKSTLLRMLASLTTPSHGEIYYQNQRLSSDRFAYWEALHFISHHNGHKLALTVEENMRLSAHLLARTWEDKAGHLAALQLSQHLHTPVAALSAGQKRRLALAKLFLFPKPIWLLDEPLTALDKHSQAYFLQQLTIHLHHQGMAILSSHQPIAIEANHLMPLCLNDYRYV